MNMRIKKMMQKLDDYFSLSQIKQNEKHDKLLKIIDNLQQKKSELKAEMINESEKDDTSEEFYKLQKKLKVISKLLKKAKKHNASEEQEKT